MKIRDWIEVRIVPVSENREAALHFLFEAGCTGIDESGEVIRAFYPGSFDESELKLILEGNFKDLGIPEYEIRRIPHEDWGSRWREHYKPIRVTDRIVVKPPWLHWNTEKDDVVIDIMPQMAFGTGTHESTQLALALMQEFLTDDRIRVLDVGTGSGILAIAAARMKPVSVIAVEIDPEAIANTRENIHLNGVDQRVRVVCGDPGILTNCAFDLILANINRNVLLELIPQFRILAAPGAVIVLSGILDSDLPDIHAALKENGTAVLKEERKNEWVGLAVRGGPQEYRREIEVGS